MGIHHRFRLLIWNLEQVQGLCKILFLYRVQKKQFSLLKIRV